MIRNNVIINILRLCQMKISKINYLKYEGNSLNIKMQQIITKNI